MATIKPWVSGAVAAAFALSISGVSKADTLAATPSLSGTTVAFVAHGSYPGGTLTVAGPNGFAVTASSKRGLPALNLAEFGNVPDGQYTYQLSAATALPDYSIVAQNNGRTKKANVRPRRGVALSGAFLVKGGSIVAPVAAASLQGGSDRDQD